MKRNLLLMLIIFMFLSILSSTWVYSYSDETIRQADMQNTGAFETFGPKELNGVKWRFKAGGAIKSTPALKTETVFFGSTDTYFYAISAMDGKLRWKFKTGDSIFCDPVFLGDTVCFGSKDFFLYALNVNTGQLKWKKKLERPIMFSTPAVKDNVIFVNTISGPVYAIDAQTGREIWKTDIIALTDPPCLYNELLLVIGFSKPVSTFLYGIDIKSGNIEWIYEKRGGNPAVHNNNVYLSAGNFIVLNLAYRETAWKYLNLGIKDSKSAITDDRVFFSGEDGWIYCADIATNTLLWKKKLEGDYEATDAITYADGCLYFGTRKGILYAFEADSGTELWRYKTSGRIVGPPIIHNGVIYFGSDDGYLYALH